MAGDHPDLMKPPYLSRRGGVCSTRNTLAASALLAAFAACAFATNAEAAAAQDNNTTDALPIEKRSADFENRKDFEVFLDRLMMAESGGRDFLTNPRSTALGPFQFIEGTFLYVVGKHFRDEVDGLNRAEVLALRTKRPFARKVIAEYSRELARHLDRHGLEATYGNLRLAYLLGPTGATRMLKAPRDKLVRKIISAAAVTANPFLANMRAADLIARAYRDIGTDYHARKLTVSPSHKTRAAKSGIKIRCNLARASCRRWLALQKRKIARTQASNR